MPINFQKGARSILESFCSITTPPNVIRFINHNQTLRNYKQCHKTQYKPPELHHFTFFLNVFCLFVFLTFCLHLEKKVCKTAKPLEKKTVIKILSAALSIN